MNINHILDSVNSQMGEVENELLRNLDSDVAMVNEVASYVFESGGKRMRPLFMILSSNINGYDGDRISKLSGVVEYIHTATLLHDDVIDGAKFRRGRPSANVLFGNDITVLCGDFLYSRAFMNLVTDGDSRIQMILAKAAKTMSEGEVFQLVKTADFSLKIDDYIKIIFSKTAVLFSACCEIGAILGNSPNEKIENMRDFGKYLGIAFQISDDILDYFGNSELTGKKPGTDLKEGKMTLPMIMLRDAVNNEESERIKSIITAESYSEEDFQYIISLMEKYNVRERSETFVDKYIQDSKSMLLSYPESNIKDYLLFLADYMVKRDR